MRRKAGASRGITTFVAIAVFTGTFVILRAALQDTFYESNGVRIRFVVRQQFLSRRR